MAVCLMVTLMCIGSVTAGAQKMHGVGIVKKSINVSALDGHEFTGSDLKVIIKIKKF